MSDTMMMLHIKQNYESFTPTEKVIADFFLHNTEDDAFGYTFAAKYVSQKLHVSEAALSRFARKLGFHGYREFVYRYGETLKTHTDKTEDFPMPLLDVFSTYEQILTQTKASEHNETLTRVGKLLCTSDQIFVYGLGSSGLAAADFELRMLKIGTDIKAVTDYHQMVLNESRLKKGSLVIGVTLSGETAEIRDALLAAARKDAATVCITAGTDKPWFSQITEVLPAATVQGLEYGNLISPMLPLLLELDLLYALCLTPKETQAGTQSNKGNEEQALWERLKHYRN